MEGKNKDKNKNILNRKQRSNRQDEQYPKLIIFRETNTISKSMADSARGEKF